MNRIEMLPAIRQHMDFAFFRMVGFMNLILAEFRDSEDAKRIFRNIPVMKAAVDSYELVFESHEISWKILCIDVVQERDSAAFS